VPIIDNVIYAAGRRVARPASLSSTLQELRAAGEGQEAFCWIGLLRPDADEMNAVAHEFSLHPLAVEDAVSAHQRAKIEQYGDVTFVVLRPARYVDHDEVVSLGEIHVFLGPNFVIAVRHADEPDLGAVRARLEGDPKLLAMGPPAVLYAIVDRVVDDYAPVLKELQVDLDEIEVQVFAAEPHAPQRTYQLTREVIEFHRAVSPLRNMLADLRDDLKDRGGDADLELRRALRDVADHVTRVQDRIEGFRELLTNLLDIDNALVARRQNEEMARLTQAGYDQNEQVKRISAWAAILFAPTLVASVYGMNFHHMPELAWPLGYPFALALMVLLGVGLYLMFKHRGWL
jgi:magnesium transporter